MAADPDFMAALEKFAAESQIPFDLLASIAAGESGFDLHAAGDDFGNGPTSFGPYQVHLPAHGHDAAHWTGVNGAVNSMLEMKDRWRREFAWPAGRMNGATRRGLRSRSCGPACKAPTRRR